MIKFLFILLFPCFVFSQARTGVIASSIRGTVTTSSIPAVLTDGNTVGWYIADDLTTITKDGANLVSSWNDKLASGHNLVQATGTNQPLWSSSGILFDGVDNYMQTATFTLIQPEFIYIVINQIAWTSDHIIFDGYTTAGGLLYQRTTTPQIAAYAGSYLNNTNLPVNTLGIVRVLFNGASSKVTVNATTPVTGAGGSGNMAGFTLGNQGNHGGGYGNIQVKEVILRKVADNSTDEASIYSYLKSKYGL